MFRAFLMLAFIFPVLLHADLSQFGKVCKEVGGVTVFPRDGDSPSISCRFEMDVREKVFGGYWGEYKGVGSDITMRANDIPFETIEKLKSVCAGSLSFDSYLSRLDTTPKCISACSTVGVVASSFAVRCR